jgi:hypothetical protein
VTRSSSAGAKSGRRRRRERRGWLWIGAALEIGRNEVENRSEQQDHWLEFLSCGADHRNGAAAAWRRLELEKGQTEETPVEWPGSLHVLVEGSKFLAGSITVRLRAGGRKIGRRDGLALQCGVGPIVKLIDFKRLASDKGITYSRNHLRRTVKTKEFPAPISVSDHRIGWDERRFTSGEPG